MTTPTKVTQMMKARTTEQLLNDWAEADSKQITVELSMVRGWIMDELEARNPAAFEKWLDGNGSVENLRELYLQ